MQSSRGISLISLAIVVYTVGELLSSRVVVLQQHTFVNIQAWTCPAERCGKVGIEVETGKWQHVAGIRLDVGITVLQLVEFGKVVYLAVNAGVVIIRALMVANFFCIP